jgi:hypothetical protein
MPAGHMMPASSHLSVSDFVKLPWWAQVLIIAPSTLFMAFLLAQSAGYIPSVAATHAEEARKWNVEAETFRSVAAKHYEDNINLSSRLARGLRIICENASRDQAARNYCQQIQ